MSLPSEWTELEVQVAALALHILGTSTAHLSAEDSLQAVHNILQPLEANTGTVQALCRPRSLVIRSSHRSVSHPAVYMYSSHRIVILPRKQTTDPIRTFST